MQVYKNVNYIKHPAVDTKVVFACDDIYFQKYGIDNLKSCINTKQSAHCHIINPSNDTIKIIQKLDESISVSIEQLDTSLFDIYQLKTYYYCARFFIANDLFVNFNVNELWICDADIIFNKSVSIPDNKKIGISYNSTQTHLWKKTQASLIYFHKDKQEFISKIIEEYLSRIRNTDFSILDSITDKFERGDLLGLDQVCMSVILLKDYLNDDKFINLHDIKNLKSKKPNDASVWILVGDNKPHNV